MLNQAFWASADVLIKEDGNGLLPLSEARSPGTSAQREPRLFIPKPFAALSVMRDKNARRIKTAHAECLRLGGK